MGKNIYVGNLSFDTTEEGLRSLFEQHGTVESAKIITDRDTGRSRGFAFVEMDTEGGDAAIQSLNGTNLDGRDLKVNEAKPREPRSNNRW
jgi:cold-inducible RNA-binding protein